MCPLLAGLMKTTVNEAPVSEMKYLWNHQHALLSSRHPLPNHTYIHKHTPPQPPSQTRTHIYINHQSFTLPPSHPHLLVPPWVMVGWTRHRRGKGWRGETVREVFFFFFLEVGGCLRVNCPSGGYQWTGQPSLLVSLVLNWQPGSDRLAASQEESMAQDTFNHFFQIWLYACDCEREWIWVKHHKSMCVCVCTGGGRWELAAGLGEDTARWGLFN